jgi:YidC/Oxa1 family membrane protein insertase
MEQPRLIIALVLSFAVFFVWNLLFAPKIPENQKEQLQQTSEQSADSGNQSQSNAATSTAAGSPAADLKPAVATIESKPARTIEVETPLYVMTLSEKGAAVVDMTMKKYRESVENDSPLKKILPAGLASGTCLIALGEEQNSSLEQVVYQADTNAQALTVQTEPISVTFNYSTAEGVTIKKSYRFSPDSYLIDVSIEIHNGKAVPLSDALKISLIDRTEEVKNELGFIGPSGLLDDKLKQIKIKEIEKTSQLSGELLWIALEQPYFMSSLVLKETINGQMVLAHQENVIKNQMVLPIDSLAPGDTKRFALNLFMGPKSWSLLRSYDNGLARAIYFGWVDILAKPCLWFMNYVYKFIPNYGIAIIILTIITRIAFWPLAQKSYKSMNDMRKLQPLMQEIREKYKNDKARINQETMALYRTYKINPMGGCLPMLVQLPVFFALYRMLYSAIELRHAPFFGWINDLSAPDRLFSFGFKIPLMNPPYGIPVLTLIMGATMLLQQKMTPTPGDPTQAKMMMFMPVIFTVIFINFSSGLVLYWLVGNIISISQQYFTQKKLA